MRAAASSSGEASGSGSDLSAVAALARPLNGLMAAVAVFVGALVACRPVRWDLAALGALAAFAAASGANALNDVLDREADSVNRPERPVPSGRVAPKVGVVVAVGAYAGALAAAWPIGRPAVVLAIVWVVATAAYSLWLKSVPVVGNVTVAFVAASPLVLGGIVQGRVGRTVMLFVLASLTHLAREFAKDAQDYDGDAMAGVRTLAVAVGPSAALAAARAAIIAVAAAAPIPFAMRVFGWGYLPALVAIEILLFRLFVAAGRPDAGAAGRVSTGLKVVMALGLVGFVLGVL